MTCFATKYCILMNLKSWKLGHGCSLSYNSGCVFIFSDSWGQKNFSSTKNCAFDTKLLIMKLYRLICMELPSDILYLVKLCWQNCNATYRNIKPLHHEHIHIHIHTHTHTQTHTRTISNSHSTEKTTYAQKPPRNYDESLLCMLEHTNKRRTYDMDL